MKKYIYEIREVGAMGTDIYLRFNQSKNIFQEILEETQRVLDKELFQSSHESWLSYIGPWSGYYRFISGLRTETRKLIAKLNKQ